MYFFKYQFAVKFIMARQSRNNFQATLSLQNILNMWKSIQNLNVLGEKYDLYNAKMHQIAYSIFTNFPGVTPPDYHFMLWPRGTEKSTPSLFSTTRTLVNTLNRDALIADLPHSLRNLPVEQAAANGLNGIHASQQKAV